MSGSRLPIIIGQGAIDPSLIAPDPGGCQQCDEHPTFPRTHCGKPGCRDAQAVAWAKATGRSAADGIASLDDQAPASPALGGLCSRCGLASICIVGRAVADAEAIGASVDRCKAFSP